MNAEPENSKIRTTYSDGQSIHSVDSDSLDLTPDTILGGLDGMARSLNNALGARVDSDPELARVRAERDATPWYRFRRRKKLSELAMNLHSEAFFRQVGYLGNSIEIIDVQTLPQHEIEDGNN